MLPEFPTKYKRLIGKKTHPFVVKTPDLEGKASGQGTTHHSTGALKGPCEWWSKASRAASFTASIGPVDVEDASGWRIRILRHE